MSARIQLPEEFSLQMRELLGEEAESFFRTYEQEGYEGIRLNTRKTDGRDLPFPLQKVPWTGNGYYVGADLPVSGHPFYYAGLYYIQEPSAMLPAEELGVCPGERVLDLCAAPGGKATELSLALQGEGLLIANDVSASRAKALLKNLTVWGAPNTCVSAETPQRLADVFGCCFDKILVDAPCSGEGMFRRKPSLTASWREKGPAAYAPLQKEILSCAVRMLKPGGMLAYSTCTFSREENEAVISDALEHFPDLTPAWPQMSEGFVRGTGGPLLKRCVRLYPHRVRGEGHFLALLQKTPSVSEKSMALPPCSEEEIAESRAQMPRAVQDFLARLPKKFLQNYRYEQIRDQCLFVPPYQLPKLRYLRTGVLLGTLKQQRFEPSEALSLLLTQHDFDAVLSLSAEDPRTVRYLKGETIALSGRECAALSQAEDGWILVCVGGHGLGWGKYAGGNLKNKYFPAWRMR